MLHVRNLSFRQKIYRLSGTVVLCFLLLIGWLFNQYRTGLYQARKHEVKSLVDSEWQLLAYYAHQADAGTLSQKKAKSRALEAVRQLRFDKGNYFWIVDRTSRFLLEPLKPGLEGLALTDSRVPGGGSLYKALSRALKEAGGLYQLSLAGSRRNDSGCQGFLCQALSQVGLGSRGRLLPEGYQSSAERGRRFGHSGRLGGDRHRAFSGHLHDSLHHLADGAGGGDDRSPGKRRLQPSAASRPDG